MANALLEINFMLWGAFLLGVFVTWQYWRRKSHIERDAHNQEKWVVEKELSATNLELNKKSNALETSQAENEKLVAHLKGLETEKAELEISLEKAVESQLKSEKQSKKLDSELTKVQKDNEDLNAAREEQEKEILSLKNQLALVNRKIELQKLKPQTSDKKVTSEEVEPSYYRIIKGKKYKNEALRMAEDAVAGQGDGRISKEDAEKIFATVSDGHQYTDVEKDTIRYIRDNFNWTEQADELFRHEVRVWAAKGHPVEA
ncbi:MAG: hypothetical protein RJQ09_19755 [Cyclobacteriaceae bacterium]